MTRSLQEMEMTQFTEEMAMISSIQVKAMTRSMAAKAMIDSQQVGIHQDLIFLTVKAEMTASRVA